MSTYPDVSGHRIVDTSIVAADFALRLDRLQRLALAAIMKAGWLGPTSYELSSRQGMERNIVQPQTTESKVKGLIRVSGQRRVNATDKKANVWIAV
ncbi:hypothetical protein [Aurantiacibacter gilvus]|uniref:Uncharacterized protein n=1 Tax=Aurantiacibacter gilvus TaxID=3139141 RepID=A0ABU9IIP0_9SPHN